MATTKRQILMLHGLSGSAKVWDRMSDLLSDSFDCKPVTLFKKLRTAKAPPIELTDLRLLDYISHAEELADRLTRESDGLRPIVIGHSFGGLLAQKLAEKGHVAAAVFLTPAQPADCQVSQLSTYLSLWSIARVPQRQWIGRSYRLHGASFRWGALHNIPKSKHAAIEAEMRYDSGHMIHDLVNDPPHIEEKRIFVPNLTIAAGNDRVIPMRGLRNMAEKYRWGGSRGDYLEYPNNTHWILDEDGTDQVAADIKAWTEQRLR